MKGKRLLAALMAGAMALGMTACSGSGGGSSSGGGGSSASDFPSKSVTIIMPWSLGGGPDTIARQVASYGDKYLGVPVIVENKTGGAGTIADPARTAIALNKYVKEAPFQDPEQSPFMTSIHVLKDDPDFEV